MENLVYEISKSKKFNKKIMNDTWDSLSKSFNYDDTWKFIRDSIYYSVEYATWESLYNITNGHSVGDLVRDSFNLSLRSSVWDSVHNKTK